MKSTSQNCHDLNCDIEPERLNNNASVTPLSHNNNNSRKNNALRQRKYRALMSQRRNGNVTGLSQDCHMEITLGQWLRTFLLGLCMGLIVGFVSGQFFHDHMYNKQAYIRIQKLEEQKEQLRKDAVPQRIAPITKK